MKLGIILYEGVNLLDVAGPLEMFTWASRDLPAGQSLDILLISQDGQSVQTMNQVTLGAHASFGETPALDVVWVPGGDVDALRTMMASAQAPYFVYLRQVAARAQWVCSVCEGALLLARAGLLDGHKATTHWAFVDCLKQFPLIEVDQERQRFVVSGNRLTGGGISAGLDEALQLILLLFGEGPAVSARISTQYFPDPPVPAQLPPAAPPCMFSWPRD